jgi:bacteriocin biosynthesis cyclodehydratase domain-containing protein
MHEVRESPKIAFAPHLDVRILDERRILLLSEDRSFLLTGKLYVAIAPHLDGSRTHDEIIDMLRSTTTAPLERIELAMSNLLTKKYAAPVPPGVAAPRAAFWTELELDPESAERSVRQTHVAVRPLGRLPGADGVAAGQLIAALAEAGFALAIDVARADLTVVLVEDYLDPQLDAINREMREAGRRWLPLKTTGRVAWLGPIFRPADGPCWACLAKRISENRPGEMRTAGGETVPRIPRGDFPAGRGLALHLAALELARVTAGVADAALAGTNVLTFDLKGLTVTRHVVHRQTVCLVCGTAVEVPADGGPLRLESRRKHPMADGGSRTCSPEEALARLEPHISPLTGLIGGLANHSLAEGLPVYGTRQIFPVAIGPRENRRIGRPEGAAGKGTTEIQAKISCLAEAVERYSTGWQSFEPRRRATLAELGPAAVHPNFLMNYSERQYAARETWNKTNSGFNWVGVPFQPDRAIDWSPMWSLSHERVRWVPTQFCYYNYRGEPDHDFYRAESNGCASGSTLEEAILQGFMELVERDSCALWWYNRPRRPAIDLASFDDPFFRRAEAYLLTKGRNLYAVDLTSDLGIPVVVALSHDAAGGKIICGLGAHLSVRIAASRAVAELNQMMVLEVAERPETTRTDDDQALARWMREATIENQAYVRPAPGPMLTVADYLTLETDDLLGDIKECIAAVQRCGLEMLVLDTTRAEVGFPTVRVTVPGLRHFWARFGPGRLYDVPVALGWLDAPFDEADLNPIPFFL